MANKQAKKPIIEVRTVDLDYDWRYYEKVEIRLNDEVLIEGEYGGEPEDNDRGRTYKWVDDLIVKLAERFGAEVKFTEVVDGEVREII